MLSIRLVMCAALLMMFPLRIGEASSSPPIFIEHPLDYVFENRPTVTSIHDVTNDGFLDLIIAEPGAAAIRAWNFAEDTICTLDDDANTRSIVVTDVDRDGDQDVIFTLRGEHQFRVCRYESGSVCPEYLVQDFPTGYAPTVAAVGDLNNDGWPDLVIGHESHSLAAYLNRGLDVVAQWRGFSQPVYIKEPSTYPFPAHIVLDDANQDGLLDVIAATGGYRGTGGVDLFLNDGFDCNAELETCQWLGSQEEIRVYDDGRGPSSLNLADLNGDGVNDLVFTFTGSSGGQANFFVALGDPQGTFEPASGQVTQDHAHAAVVGDFDRDGGPDVLTGHYRSQPRDNYLLLHRNDGSANFPEVLALRIEVSGDAPIYLAAGDLDDDGDTDFAVSFSVSQTASVFENMAPDQVGPE